MRMKHLVNSKDDGHAVDDSALAINQHLKRIFDDNELEHMATVKKIFVDQTGVV
jgi:hypothetical protein